MKVHGRACQHCDNLQLDFGPIQFFLTTFLSIRMPNHFELISNNGQAPSDEFKLGLEYNKVERAHWCVLVTTPYGTIPGKVGIRYENIPG